MISDEDGRNIACKSDYYKNKTVTFEECDFQYNFTYQQFSCFNKATVEAELAKLYFAELCPTIATNEDSGNHYENFACNQESFDNRPDLF